MSRYKARDAAMKVLYRYGITGDSKIPDESETLFTIEKLSENDMDYLKNTIKAYENNAQYIDKRIEDNLKGWAFNRISKVDLAILRLALTEINFMETPAKVAVNEAVKMAKLYSEDKSYKFINGLLANAIKA